MNCSHCNKPITLTPSAAERAKTFGGQASDYTGLFTMHTRCAIDKRNKDTLALIRETRQQCETKRVRFTVKKPV